MRRESKYELAIGESVVVLRRVGARSYTTGRILGRERGPAGDERIWVDRVLAPHGTATIDGWVLGGAVSTVLSRPGEPAGKTEP